MPIEKGPLFASEDVYVDYPFEEVMYRWDHKTEEIFVKFYGKQEHGHPIPSSNRLFNDALLYGDRITRADYLKGKKRREYP